jgi:hypothetical protein
MIFLSIKVRNLLDTLRGSLSPHILFLIVRLRPVCCDLGKRGLGNSFWQVGRGVPLTLLFLFEAYFFG